MSATQLQSLIPALEAAAADVGRRFVDTLQRIAPEVGATCINVAGGAASYAGPDSPLTGVKGLQPRFTHQNLAEIEDFFAKCGAPAVVLELASWIPSPRVGDLVARGYQQVAEELVIVRDLELHPRSFTPSLPVESVSGSDTFAQVMIESFSLPHEDKWRLLGEAFCQIAGTWPVAVVENGCWMGAAHLMLSGEVATLGCDGTLPAFRGRGVQCALIQERLRLAAQAGARWAVAEVLPDSGSMRNYLRHGFEVVCSRRHWARDLA
ncbi:MAG: hypothetical protein KIT83_05320 [Bryobacterales bacterium]|nr:hypothetical protein [Bryobacterales bacterium]